MANRTLKFYGKGYGATPASVTVQLDGVQVYTGTVPTVDQETIERLPEEQVVLFTIDVPIELAGSIPMICQTNLGTIFWAFITGNYVMIPNPVFTTAEFEIITDPSSTTAERMAVYEANAVPPLSPAEIALLSSTDPIDQPAQFEILQAHKITTYVYGGPDVYGDVYDGEERSEVYINGVEQTPTRPPSVKGTWGWVVDADQTLSYNLNIIAGSLPPAP
jgi:hypothetical protein